jgi:hypothetical protein
LTLRHLADGVTAKVARVLSAKAKGRIDLFRPGLAAGFGPFNGQERREAIVRSVLEALPIDLVIETGTYRGTTTERLRRITTAPIVTIEVSPRYHEYSRLRLARLSHVRVVQGESAAMIRRIASSSDHDPRVMVFAYLDAHWGSSLPARYEILELMNGWDEFCALIDDFKVPGDPGYGFDDYGPGAVLDATLLEGLPLEGVSLFYPRVPSADETGCRRGWIVLGRGKRVVAGLRMLDGLTIASDPGEFLGTR